MNAIILPPLWFCTLYCSQNICRTFSDISLLIPKISLRVQRIVPFPYKESSWTVVMSSSLKKGGEMRSNGNSGDIQNILGMCLRPSKYNLSTLCFHIEY